MLEAPPCFPDEIPDGYQHFADETSYDAGKHLNLEWPERIWTLEEFGYGRSEIAMCASPVAVTSPFRLLSQEGVNALYEIVTRLKSVKSTLQGNRAQSYLAGGVYRSKFLKDLCACPVILDHLSRISGTKLAPHSMPSQQVYVNYAPEDITKAVDAWHFDGIGFDYVAMLTDPSSLKGGNFEYFQGTKFEVAKMYNLEVNDIRQGITEELDENRVIKTQFPEAGFAIFQQGSMIIHRAAKLLEPADRITIVPGLVSEDISQPDPTAIHDIPDYGEPGIKVELARHSAWLAQGKLKNLINSQSLNSDDEEIVHNLKQAVSDVTALLDHLEAASRTK